jgi:signal transduction histidine kinase
VVSRWQAETRRPCSQLVEVFLAVAKRSIGKSKESEGGKLRIGDDWNAIRIIALSQGNPLKAIAELVENSIDAHAKSITIIRGREHGEHCLTVKDDGDGVPRDPNGLPTSSTSRLISATQSNDA